MKSQNNEQDIFDILKRKPKDMNEAMQEANKFIDKAEVKKATKLNVLIVGKTGVGKSTLINAIFGSNVAKTGSGKPITQNADIYQVSNTFSIIDSKGIEVANYEHTKRDIIDLLDRRAKGNDTSGGVEVDSQIHIALLCIQEPGRRIEPSDKEIWDLLKKYEIPSLVVITKASQDIDENGEKFSDKVKKEFKIDDERLERVRAVEIKDDDGETKPKKGIIELVNKIKNQKLLDEAHKNAFERWQTADKTMRKKQQKKIKEDARSAINKYTVLASGVAASPIPFSDIAILLPTQCAMIVHVSRIYGLEFDMDSAKKVATAFAGVVGIGFATRFAVGNALKFIPGLGTIAGGAFNATAAGAITKLMGEAYIAYLDDNFDNLLDMFDDLNPANLSKYYEQVKDLVNLDTITKTIASVGKKILEFFKFA